MTSLARRPDGVWRARYFDAEGKERSRHFQKQKDAKEWLDEQTTSLRRGDWIDPKAGKTTFANYYAQWADRQVWVAGTAKAMNLAARSVPFSNVQLRGVTRSHVEAWVKGMDTAGLAASTINTRFNNVRAILRAAHRDKFIAADPCEGVRLPRQRRTEHAMVLPAPGDVGKLIDAADVWFRPFVGLCAFAGLRLGEAAAVQVGDVDFLRRTLKVTRQVQRVSAGVVEIRAPKYHSERLVYLPGGLVELLAAHVEHVGTWGAVGWLFVGEGDNPPHQNTVGYWWRKTLKATDVAPFKLHDLRHFYASGLIAAGCDVVTVQRALGHASAATTLRVYSHMWPTAEDRPARPLRR